jgi:hypothetical protein
MSSCSILKHTHFDCGGESIIHAGTWTGGLEVRSSGSLWIALDLGVGFGTMAHSFQYSTAPLCIHVGHTPGNVASSPATSI